MKATIIFDVCKTNDLYTVGKDLYINGSINFKTIKDTLYSPNELKRWRIFDPIGLNNDVCYEVKMEICEEKDLITTNVIEFFEKDQPEDKEIINKK